MVASPADSPRPTDFPTVYPSPYPTRFPTSASCSEILITGATVSQQDKMGRYKRLSNRVSGDRPVYQRYFQFLYFYPSSTKWAIGNTIGGNRAWMFVSSTAYSPDKISSTSVWRVSKNGKLHERQNA